MEKAESRIVDEYDKKIDGLRVQKANELRECSKKAKSSIDIFVIDLGRISFTSYKFFFTTFDKANVQLVVFTDALKKQNIKLKIPKVEIKKRTLYDVDSIEQIGIINGNNVDIPIGSHVIDAFVSK